MQDIESVIRAAAERAAAEAVSRALSTRLPAPEYLNTEQAAAYLGLSRQYLEIKRCRGGGPRFVKLGSAVRYKRSELDKYMQARERRSTSEG